MSDDKELFEALAELDTTLANTNLENVTAETGAARENLPDGYYLCEVRNAELVLSNSSKKLQVKFTLKTVNNGYTGVVDDKGDFYLSEIDNTKNKNLYKYYPLKDSAKITSFVADMLKFEGEEPGVPILDKEYFTNSEVLADALNILNGLYIYVMLSTTERNGEKNQWINLISWDRAAKLELPME